MANNIEVTAGTGTTLKTTDTAGVHTTHHNIDAIMGGSIAADAADSTNPVGIGGLASTAIPTAVSDDNDRVKAWFDRNGSQMARPRPAATATLANVSASASSVTVLALNTARLGVVLFNDSQATLYLKYGSNASTTSFTYKIAPLTHWEMPGDVFYTGILTGVWESATGTVRTTELTS